MIAVFQIITLDNWTNILFNLMNHTSLPQIPAFFCILLVFLVSFFLMNLMLGVVMESYTSSEVKESQYIEEELKKEKENLVERLQELDRKDELGGVDQKKEEKVRPNVMREMIDSKLMQGVL
jgi:hypothetical protein